MQRKINKKRLHEEVLMSWACFQQLSENGYFTLGAEQAWITAVHTIRFNGRF